MFRIITEKYYSKNLSNYDKYRFWIFIILLFFIPISRSMVNAMALLLLFIFLYEGQFRNAWEKWKINPIFWVFLAYIIIFPLSVLWSDNLAWSWEILRGHLRYLLLPVALLFVRREWIPVFIVAFVAGVVFTGLISYLVWFELIEIQGVDPLNPTPFYSHVHASPMLAWVFYLLMHGLLFSALSRQKKYLIMFLIIAVSVNIFITAGRSGQIAYFVLLILIMLQYFVHKKMLLQGVAYSSLLVIFVFSFAYSASQLFNERVNLAISEIKNYQPDSRTSVGLRLSFAQNTWHMAFNRDFTQMLLGSGIGDFPEEYTASLRYPDAEPLYAERGRGSTHPHNQYLYHLGALGVVGFFILIALYAVMLKYALTMNDDYSRQRIALIILMLIIMLPDTVMMSRPLTYMFVAFSAFYYFNACFGDKR